MNKMVKTVTVSMLALLIAAVPIWCCCFIDPAHAAIEAIAVAPQADVPPCHEAKAASEPQSSKDHQNCDCAKIFGERVTGDKIIGLVSAGSIRSIDGQLVLAFSSLSSISAESNFNSVLSTSPPRALSIPLFLRNPSLRI